jgi:hypothetical protein
MEHLRRDFHTKAREIRTYIRLLSVLDAPQATASGGGVTMPVGGGLFQVMKAGVFLHLYNLVEATVSVSLRRIGEAIKEEGATYGRLNEKWRRAWIKQEAQTSGGLAPDKRLELALALCDRVVRDFVIDFVPDVNTGNLDDRRIEDVAKAYGVELRIRPKVVGLVKFQVLNDQGALGLVRVKRNTLAHGQESFSDCGRAYTVAELRRHTIVTILYLRDVIASFERFLRDRKFAA